MRRLMATGFVLLLMLLLAVGIVSAENWDEVIELSKKENVTIGSHCMSHICCHENQNPGEVKKQITNSKFCRRVWTA